MTIYRPIKKEDIAKRIDDSRNESLDSRLTITINSLKAYAAATFKYGSRSDAARDALHARKEFIRIIKEENKIFKFLLQNLHLMNLEAASDVISQLDELKDETIKYYNTVFEDIKKGSKIGIQSLTSRASKNFKTLLETEDYRAEAMALLENTNTIKEYLKIPQIFWDFIEDKCHVIDMSDEVADGMTFVKPVYDEDKHIYSLLMTVPKPNNLHTALLAIQSYLKAYYYYLAIGFESSLEDEQDVQGIKDFYVMHLKHKSDSAIK